MPIIRVLPENLANRIAAGEVVERPASVVKELVENALDAGATRIEVELREGGRKLIKVGDNGCGMTGDDLLMAVQRFATSKITQADDLEHIATMGFRGEALPSIGAVSHLRLTSRQPEASEGAMLTIEGGHVFGPEAVGCPLGTTVEVSDLFYNTPARMKFLATTATERGHSLGWVQHLALARPDVAFKFTHDGQVLFVTPGSGELPSVLAAIYGAAAARDFLPVAAETDHLRLSGYVSGPRLTRATRQHQLFFINRRFVRSRQLSHALGEAYGLLLGPGKSPLCAIHFSLAPQEVDPNVHPTKIEVRFRSPAGVYQTLQRAVEEALAEAGFRSLTYKGPREVSGPPSWQGPGYEERQRAQRLQVNPFADSVDQRDDGLEVFGEEAADMVGGGAEDAGPQTTLVTTSAADGVPEVIGQVGNRYLVARLGSNLLLIDQHRAAERILLESITSDKPQARQLLAVPLTLELTPNEQAAVEQHQEALGGLGFELEPFGPAAWVLRSVPSALVGADYAGAVRELIEDLAAWEAPAGLAKRDQEIKALVACHAAIKKNQRLSLAEMQRLVRDLYATQSPAVCPHGDPIILTLTLEQLDRRFRRL